MAVWFRCCLHTHGLWFWFSNRGHTQAIGRLRAQIHHKDFAADHGEFPWLNVGHWAALFPNNHRVSGVFICRKPLQVNECRCNASNIHRQSRVGHCWSKNKEKEANSSFRSSGKCLLMIYLERTDIPNNRFRHGKGRHFYRKYILADRKLVISNLCEISLHKHMQWFKSQTCITLIISL